MANALVNSIRPKAILIEMDSRSVHPPCFFTPKVDFSCRRRLVARFLRAFRSIHCYGLPIHRISSRRC